MTELQTNTLEVPGAVLTYDIRRAAESSEPPLFLIGSPMGAAGFATLASHFPDRTVVTYDPRGIERSKRTDGAIETTPDAHGDDIGRIIAALGRGPVDLFASSGGAVNALALVAKHPEHVRTLVAHEPPAAQVLADRTEAIAAIRDIGDTYKKSGAGAGMVKFISLVMLKGPIPEDFAARPMPDPSAFGLPSEDDGSRNDPLLGQNLVSCTGYEHDFAALRSASTRIVIAAGAESEGEMANRGAYGVAERLGIPVTVFPSDHGGFLGGEYGQTGKPKEFADALRASLSGARAPVAVP